MRGMSTWNGDITRYDFYNLYVKCYVVYQKKWLSKEDVHSITNYIRQLLSGI